MGRWPAWIVGVSLVTSGCSLVVDSSGLTGGAEPQATSTAPTEGPSPRPALPVVPDPPSCDGLALCDDFDRAAVRGAWSGIDDNVGVADALGIVAEDAASFLRARLVPRGTMSTAKLYHRVEKTDVRRISYAFRMRFPSYPANGVQTAGLAIGNYPASVNVVIDVEPTRVALFEQSFEGGGFFEHALPSVTPGAWHRIELVVELETPPRILVQVDGTRALDVPARTGMRRGPVGVNAGASYASPTPAFQLDLDAVRLGIE